MTNHNGKSRDDLAREANQVRTKLLRTVEQLDQRRHEALDLRKQVQEHVRQLTVAAGVLMLLVAGGVALVVHRVSTGAERRRRYRWRFAKRVWQHPERAMRAERRSFFGEVLRSVLLTVVSTALALPARRAVALLTATRTRTGEPVRVDK
jgi:ABC-type phosphate transport system permease subunit